MTDDPRKLVEQLQAWATEWEEVVRNPGDDAPRWIRESATTIERLLDENAALREDKERLEWLEKLNPYAWRALAYSHAGNDYRARHKTLRAAIDAARREEKP